MTPNGQKIISCVARVAAATAFFALHTVARAQMSPPALIVAPDIMAIAAPAGMPTVTPAVMTPPLHAPATDVTKPTVVTSLPPAAAVTAASCSAPAAFSRFDRPLVHTMRQLASGQPLTIVAIGSSSTAGAGASSPAASYPYRLAIELRQRFPGHDITVLNRGVNGEETDDMMARFATGVIAEHPQLVLWQVGTNSVLRDRALSVHAAQLHAGIEQLKATGADVVLIDPQYVPTVLAKSETDGMVDQISAAAKEENVDLFQRFAVMRDWHEIQHLPFNTFVSPDDLHMNDWGYNCWARLMAGAIAEAATRPVASAAVHPAQSTVPAKTGIQ
jgi:lysophospholipase L1-like esterase